MLQPFGRAGVSRGRGKRAETVVCLLEDVFCGEDGRRV